MRGIMALLVSILALVLTFYQLYLQRVHNEKSFKPLGVIEFLDRDRQISIYIRNNGVGPLIVNKLSFTRGEIQFENIEKCLTADPRSYMYFAFEDGLEKVVPPGGYLVVFESNFNEDEVVTKMDFIRQDLAGLSMQAQCKDIYDNKITLQRRLSWFNRKLQTAIKI
jgi:hypothetical protein